MDLQRHRCGGLGSMRDGVRAAMHRLRRFVVVCLALVGLALPGILRPGEAAVVEPYAFGVTNPLAATIVGTPPDQAATLPDLYLDWNAFRGNVRIFPEREPPPVFWFDGLGMTYGVVRQRGPAPLVFLIAGTGAAFNSGKTQLLARALYQGGFHVVGISSPTFPNFMVTASESGVPGRMRDDARDIYRALQKVWGQIKDDLDATSFSLAGYSLGAMNAAFVSEIDSREKVFDFQHVLMLNPPVSLWNSMTILDGYLDNTLRNDPRLVQEFFTKLLEKFAALYTQTGTLDLTGDFLFRIYEQLQPDATSLEIIIGAAFRLSSNSMAFTSDVLTHSNYVVPADAQLTPLTGLTNVFTVGNFLSFQDYFDQVYMPYYQKREPGLTRDQAIADARLQAIEPYLRSNPRIGVFTNADDIILAPGELDYLSELFEGRITIFPYGGHMGNYGEKQFVERLNAFFRGSEGGAS